MRPARPPGVPSFSGTPLPFPDVVPGPDVHLPHERAVVLAAQERAAGPTG